MKNGDYFKFMKQEMKMPFGKYKGANLSEIPINYLVWLKDKTDLWEPLKSQVESIVSQEPQKLEKLVETLQEVYRQFRAIYPAETRQIFQAIKVKG